MGSLAIDYKVLPFLILLYWRFINGEIHLDIGNEETSDETIMSCSSAYCSNTTVFTFSQEKQCYNPLLTVNFRLTDFLDQETQYLTIKINQQRLGFCTGPNIATFESQYNTSSIPLYQCINSFSIAEFVGNNPTAVSLQLRLSPRVENANNSYNGNLLYATVAFGCSGIFEFYYIFTKRKQTLICNLRNTKHIQLYNNNIIKTKNNSQIK